MDNFLALVTQQIPGNTNLRSQDELSGATSNSQGRLQVSRQDASGQTQITIPVNDFDYRQCTAGTWIYATPNQGIYHTVPLYTLPAQQIQQIVPSNLQSVIQKTNPSKTANSALQSILNNATKVVQNTQTNTLGAEEPPFETLPPCPHWAYTQSLLDVEAGIGFEETSRLDNYIRIGDIAIVRGTGPLDLDIMSQPQVNPKVTLRQNTAIKKISGTVRQTIRFRLLFSDPISIATELVPLLRQAKRAPFIPVIHGELLRNDIDSLAIQSINVNTVPGFPGQLEAEVTAQNFNSDHYLMDADSFEDSINYALLHLWLSAGRNYSPDTGATDLYQIESQWSGRLALSLPSESWLDLLQNLQVTTNSDAFKKTYYNGDTDVLSIAGQAIDGDEQSYQSLTQNPAQGVFAISNPTFFKSDTSPFLDLSVGSSSSSGDYIGIYLDPLTARTALQPASSGGAPIIVEGATVQGNTIIYDRDTDSTLTDRVSQLTRAFILPNQQTAYDQAHSSTSEREKLLQGVVDGTYVPNKLLALYPKGSGSNLGKDITVGQALQTTSQVGTYDNAHPVYDDPIEFQNFFIESASFMQLNTLADVTPADLETPIYQMTGSPDTVISFVGTILEEDAITLYQCLQEVSRLAAQYRGQWDGSPYGGFCFLSNDIARVANMGTVIPIGMQMSTIEGFPTARRVQINFVNFDPGQRRIVAPGNFSGRTSVGDPNITVGTIWQDLYSRVQANMQYDDILQKIDLYPDIQPPTWNTLCTWLKDVRDGNIWDDTLNAAKPGYEFLYFWPYSPEYVKDNAPEFAKFLTSTDFDTIQTRSGFCDPDFYIAGRGDITSPTGSDYINAGLDSLYDPKDPHLVRYTDTEDGMSFAVSHGQSGFILPETDRVRAGVDANLEAAPSMVRDGKAMKQIKDGLVVPVPGIARNVKSSNFLLPKNQVPVSPVPTVKDPLTGEKLDKSEQSVISNLVQQYKIGSDVQLALDDAAVDAKVPRNVAYNMAATESGFRPNLSGQYSGLMQISQDVFRSWSSDTSKGINDPYQNAYSSLRYLSSLQARYSIFLQKNYSSLTPGQNRKLSYQIAACAYNTGPGKSNYEKFINSLSAKGYSVTTFQQAIYTARQAGTHLGSWRLPSLAYARGDVTKDLSDDSTLTSTAPIGDTTTNPFVLGGETVLSSLAAQYVGPVATAATDIAQNSLLNFEEMVNPFLGLSIGQPKDSGLPDSPPNDAVWDYDRAVHDPTNGEDIYWSLRRAEKSGRLVQAYPTFLVLLVNGGTWLSFYRIFDTFYGLRAPMHIKTFASRESPADTCTICFADPYNQLSAQSADNAISAMNDTRDDFSLAALEGMFQLLPNSLLDRLTEETESLLIKPGNRLHVRLGYGGNARSLPVVFNGVISTVKKQDDEISVVALGDGVELVSQIDSIHGDQEYYEDIGAGGQGKDPRNLILDIMTAAQSPLIANLTAGIFEANNPYGISHFGDPRYFPGIKDAAEVGINVYSGWGDQPVNITTSADEEIIFPFNSLVTGDQLISDLQKKVENFLDGQGDNFLDGYSSNEFWRVFNGEVLVGLRMEHATPWGIIETLRQVCLDYIAAPEPFSLRSTLFFGKDWWPYHYQYDYSQVQALQKTDILTYDAATNNSQGPSYEVFYRRRPFTQLHVAHAGYNLIGTEFEATQEGWATQVQSVGTVGGILLPQQSETSLTQMLDANIYDEFQRQKIVHSGLASTVAQRFDDTLVNLDPSRLFTSTNALNNHAVGALHDEVRLMYDGYIWSLGNGYLRPRHMLHLQDNMNQRSGLVEIREVTHDFSGEAGYISRTVPDCIAFAQDTSKMLIASHMASAATKIYFSRQIARYYRSENGGRRIRKAMGSIIGLLGRGDDRFNAFVGGPFRWRSYYFRKWLRETYQSSKVPAVQKINKITTKAGVGARALYNPNNQGLGQGDVIKALDDALQEISQKNPDLRNEADELFRNRVIHRAYVRPSRELQRELSQKAYSTLLNQASKRIGRSLTQEEERSILALARKTIKDQYKVKKPGEDLFEHGVLTDLSKELKKGDSVLQTLKTTIEEHRVVVVASRLSRKSKVGVATLVNLLPDKVKNTTGVKSAVDFVNNQAKLTGGLSTEAQQAFSQQKDLQSELDNELNLQKSIAAKKAHISQLQNGTATRSSTSEISQAQAELRALQDQANPSRIPTLRSQIQELGGKVNSLRKSAAASEKALLVAKKAEKAGLLAKTGLTATKLIKELDPLAIGIQCIIGGGITTLNRWLGSRHALKIIPIRSCGREFVAGINGHHGAVVGDLLGPLDNVIEDLFNSDLLNRGSITTFVLGLNDPLYGPYGTSDPEQYKNALTSLGVKNLEDGYAQVLQANRDQLKILATLNENGPRPGIGAPVETNPGNAPNNSYNPVQPQGGSKVSQIISEGMKYVGTGTYRYGAASIGLNTDTFDCSSLVKALYGSVGINLPRTAASQARIGTDVSVTPDLNSLQPGDRLYFTFHGSTIDHTGLYLGDGQFLEASRHHPNDPSQDIRVSSISAGNYYYTHLTAVKRSPELSQ